MIDGAECHRARVVIFLLTLGLIHRCDTVHHIESRRYMDGRGVFLGSYLGP